MRWGKTKIRIERILKEGERLKKVRVFKKKYVDKVKKNIIIIKGERMNVEIILHQHVFVVLWPI